MKKFLFILRSLCKVGLLFSLSIVHCPLSIAQAPTVKQWDYRYGGSADEQLSGFQETADGGFILGGLSLSGISGDKTQASQGADDFWVVKLDANGNKVWDRSFGGTDQDVMNTLLQTSDGGYIIGGLSRSGAGGDKTQPSWGGDDIWVVKIDSLGNKQWDKTFGGDSIDRISTIKQTADGGYIVGGHSVSSISGNKTQASRGGTDYWIVKIDSLGNYQWDKTFGGTDTERLHGLQQTADGGYILAGDSRSGIGGDKTQAAFGGADYWLVKVDSSGNFQWDQTYGGTNLENNTGVVQTPDGGYLLGCESRSIADGNKLTPRKGSSDYWIIKTDMLGVRQWENVYGAAQTEEFYSFYPTKDGGYLLLGDSYSMLPGGDKTEPNLGLEQIWAVKIDSAGNKLWDKTMMTTGHDEGGTGAQVKDGCYVFAGFTNADTGGYKTQLNWDTTATSFKTYDFWIIKFCDSTFSVVPPQSNFLAADTTLCANDCISFTNLSSNATTYQWYFAGGTPPSSTEQNPYVCYQSAGSYDVKLVAYNAGGSDSITFNNYIHVQSAPPTPVITPAGATLYCSTDPSYISYQWYDSTTLIPGATDTVLIISHSGNYNVEVANSTGCKIAVGINVILGVQNFIKDNSILIYPNPAHNSLQFAIFTRQTTNGELIIYNTLGEVVQNSTFLWRGDQGVRRTPDSYGEADISSLSSGVYFLQLKTIAGIATSLFVKE